MELKIIEGNNKPLKRKKYSKADYNQLINFETKNSPKGHLQKLIDIADNIEDMIVVYTTKNPSKLIIRASDSIGLWSQIGLLEMAVQYSTDEARGK